MKWHYLVTSAAVFAVAAGCATDHPAVAVAAGRETVVASPAADPPAVERLQKPDGDGVKPASFSTRADRPLEVPSDHGDGEVVAAIRATVNGVPILQQEVDNASYGLLDAVRSLPEPERTNRTREIKDKVLESLIDRELLIQDATTRFGPKSGGAKFMEKVKEAADKEFDRQVVRGGKERYKIKTDEEFKALLSSQGVTLDGLRHQFERQFIYQQYLQFLVQPKLDRIGHEQIVEYFQNHADEFRNQDSVTWQDIFVAVGNFAGDRARARQFAEQVRQRAAGGEDFAALARQYDNGTSSYQNGEGIGHKRGEIQPRQAEPLLFQMKDGQVGALVELDNGFHVIRLVKREYAGQMEFNEKSQMMIRDKLRNEAFSREAKHIVAGLRGKATIQLARGPGR
jgi:parvulin-like peptidyl-prolyl isomerase